MKRKSIEERTWIHEKKLDNLSYFNYRITSNYFNMDLNDGYGEASFSLSGSLQKPEWRDEALEEVTRVIQLLSQFRANLAMSQDLEEEEEDQLII